MGYSERMYGGKLDAITSNKTVIELEHAEIHAGSHYAANHYVTSSAMTTAGFVWLFRTADVSCHFKFRLEAALNGEWTFLENCTASGAGTTMPAYNNLRTSVNSANAACFSSATLSASGTQMFKGVLGNDGATPNGNGGGSFDRSDELVLKPSTTYAVKFTPAAAATRAACFFSWYEG